MMSGKKLSFPWLKVVDLFGKDKTALLRGDR